jgi:hypothetical protein
MVFRFELLLQAVVKAIRKQVQEFDDKGETLPTNSLRSSVFSTKSPESTKPFT